MVQQHEDVEACLKTRNMSSSKQYSDKYVTRIIGTNRYIMGHIEEKASTRKSHFLKNATELLLAGLVVVITACKSEIINT